MTLPLNYNLPQPSESTMKDGDPTTYLKDLVFELETMYETTTQNVNGVFRNSDDVDGSQYIPTLKGSITTGTFTYTRQSSYVLRQGLMTDVWFDVIWTANAGATGQLRLVLPYRQAIKSGIFFVGTCFMNKAPFPAGTTTVSILGVAGTYEISFQAYGSGIDTSAINVYAQGRVGGHIRYIGIADE